METLSSYRPTAADLQEGVIRALNDLEFLDGDDQAATRENIRAANVKLHPSKRRAPVHSMPSEAIEAIIREDLENYPPQDTEGDTLSAQQNPVAQPELIQKKVTVMKGGKPVDFTLLRRPKTSSTDKAA